MGKSDHRTGNSVTPTRESAGLAPISGLQTGVPATRTGYKRLTYSCGFRRFEMSKLKLVAAFAALSAAILAPSLAEARGHHRYHRHYTNPLPYPISYLHNYGPGIAPGTFAFYDGPSTNHCYQSAAAYVGQDRRRHPCF
jgi:hypothetical protein